MIAELCGAAYARSDHSIVHCTYLAGHPDTGERCSWFAVKAQDEADAERMDYTPEAIQALLDAVSDGVLDHYIEAILAVCHTRKRTKRGVDHGPFHSFAGTGRPDAQ